MPHIMRLFRSLLPLLLIATPAFAEVRQVRGGENLQAALNTAQPGDELRLAPGATFTGNFVLPVTTGDAFITIRTDLPDEGKSALMQAFIVTGEESSQQR